MKNVVYAMLVVLALLTASTAAIAFIGLKGYDLDDAHEFIVDIGISGVGAVGGALEDAISTTRPPTVTYKTSTTVYLVSTTTMRQTTTVFASTTLAPTSTTTVSASSTVSTTTLSAFSTLSTTTVHSAVSTTLASTTTVSTTLASTTVPTTTIPPSTTLYSLLRVLLYSPAHGIVDYGGNVTFSYTPESDAAVLNCSLYVSDGGGMVLKAEDTTIFAGRLNTFYVPGLAAGSYSWNVYCVDGAGRTSGHVVDYVLDVV